MVQKFMVEKSGVEKFMVEKSGVEKFLFALGLKRSWLKSPGLKGLGLKLGVEKSGVDMSFNHFFKMVLLSVGNLSCCTIKLFYL